MRRKRKTVPNAGQPRLSFMGELEKDQGPRPEGDTRGGRGRFIDDSIHGLRLGEQSLKEYLEERSLGWVVRLRAELEKIDFTELIVGYQSTGRRPYHPRTILGLIVYGLLCRQGSLRELEALASKDVGAWWICGGLQPDHSTIGDFVQRHEKVLTEAFYSSLVAQLVGRAKVAAGLVAGDGTVVEAAASHHRLLRREAAEQEAQQARAAAAAAPQDQKLEKKAQQAEAVYQAVDERTKKQLAKKRGDGSARIAANEPEAVVQKGKDGAFRPSYKPSALVHESGLIVAQQLHPTSEITVMKDLLERHREVFGVEPECVLLDAGYFSSEVLPQMAERGIDVLCPSGQTTGDWQKKSTVPGKFAKSRFTFDEDRNAYRCPAAVDLLEQRSSVDREGRSYRLYGGAACSKCELRDQCTSGRGGRTIIRYDGDELKEAMAVVMQQPAARRRFRLRKQIVERIFAELRMRQGLIRFHRRGSNAARAEFALHCIAFNLKWAIGRTDRSIHSCIVLLVIAPRGDVPVAIVILMAVHVRPLLGAANGRTVGDKRPKNRFTTVSEPGSRWRFGDYIITSFGRHISESP